MKHEAHLDIHFRECLNDQPRSSSLIVRVALVSVFRRARPACDTVRHRVSGVSGARIPNYHRSRIDIRGTIRRRANVL